MEDLSQDIEAYAALAAALAEAGPDRARVLAARGLTEAQWEALDQAWQARLSEEGEENAAGVPALLAAYAEAFARAQRARARAVMPFERFVEAAREMQRGADLARVLQRLDMSLPDFMASQQHWTARMLEDGALAARFRKAMR
jgi:hypothetical protein